MYILGLSAFYHDSSAALVKDGELIAAAEEERFSRKKHDFGFPHQSTAYVLREAGITIDDVDVVAYYEKPMTKFHRIIESNLAAYPKSYRFYLNSVHTWLGEKLWIPSILKKELGYEGEILYSSHHLSHAATAFLLSPFEEAAILTVDGVGEWTTTAIGTGHGRELRLTHEARFPHSLGLLYSTITAFLGFEVNEGEYKVMGLASFGEPTYLDEFRKIVRLYDDGSFKLDMSYFSFLHRLEMPSEKFKKIFGPPRKKGDPMTKHHQDIAASCQRRLEEILIHMVNRLHERTHMDNLCMAGGVALNCTANWKIMKETPFKNFFCFPDAGDGGGAIGAAYYIHNTILAHDKRFPLPHAYYGPQYSPEECRSFLETNGIPYSDLGDEKAIAQKTAKLISEDKVIGWYQGRMEIGPRALGSRSILANPGNPDMQGILNRKIKRREEFRPFAPSVLIEYSKDYFDIDIESPYMLLIGEVKPDKRGQVPSITHVDGTARPQMVRREVNPLYYDMIDEFRKLTGIPLVINTSFNVKGEPIVESPRDAFNCFMNTEIDYLVLGRYLIDKKAVKSALPQE